MGALRSAAQPVARQARKNAPSKRVKKAVTVVAQRWNAATKAAARIGARKGIPAATLARLLEHGTEPHFIGPKKKKIMHFPSGRGRWQTWWRGGMHPGARPHPWLVPALTGKRAEAEHEFALALQRQVTKLHLRMLKRHAARAAAGR